MKTIESPCLDICELESGFCKGCKRSQYEIENWLKFTIEQRVIIINELKKRVI